MSILPDSFLSIHKCMFMHTHPGAPCTHNVSRVFAKIITYSHTILLLDIFHVAMCMDVLSFYYMNLPMFLVGYTIYGS